MAIDTRIVLVTTTMAASNAMIEMGPAATPIRWEMFSTKPRAESGVRMSKLSVSPGPSWRRARMETRARSSAASVARSVEPVAWGARASTCSVCGGPNVRSNARRGIQTLRSSEVPPTLPSRSCTPTTRKPRPASRSVAPSGSRSGNSDVAMSHPITATCAAWASSSGPKKRPLAIARSRMVDRDAVAPTTAAFS